MHSPYHIVKTLDGSHTIFVPAIGDHYHSVNGAVCESEHIFIRNGFDVCQADPVNIFEVGFGTGLNALLTVARSIETSRKVNYTCIEKYFLDDETIRSLNHFLYAGEQGKEIYTRLHEAEAGSVTKICNNFNINKIKGDLVTDIIPGKYDLIYFDAFGPDKQPEMWSDTIFEKIAGITNSGGIFVTYSAKGDVKRNLRKVGFDVSVIPGPPGKRHIIRAIKI